MTSTWVTPLAAAGLLSSSANAALAAVALLLLLVVAIGGGAWLRARRRQLVEVRSLIDAIESVRGGGDYTPGRRAPGSPLSLVIDAVDRLGAESEHRRRDTGSAGERLRAVMDAAEDTAVVTTDLDGDVTSFSRGASALFGWDEDAVLSGPAAVLFHGDAFKDLLPKLTRRALREQGLTTRSTLARQDGTSFPGSLTVRMIADAERRPAGFLMIVKDVSDQARLESELRESEGRYRGLVEALSEGVAIAQGGRLAFANPAFARLYDLPAAALVGRPLRELVATRDVLLVEERVEALEREGGPEQGFRAQLVDGAGVPLARVAVRAARVDFGGRPAVLLLARDETVERRVEAELRRNEAQLDAVLEAMSDGLLVLSREGPGTGVQMTNRAFAEMFGLDVRAILGRSLADLQSSLIARDQASAALVPLLRAGGEPPAGMTLHLGGERPREIEVRVAALADRAGQALGRVLAFRDMTARRHSEAELQGFAEQLQLGKAELEAACARLETANAGLRGRAEELDRLNGELHALNEMKTQLLGNVAHELQTPLVSVRGYTEMILKGRLGAITEEQRKGLTLALKNVDRLISMIDNLLSFTRAQSDLDGLNLQRFELAPLLRETRESLLPLMSGRRLEYRERLAAAGREVFADREKIAQVLTNLLSNAIKFNKEGGLIEISSTYGEDDQLFVRVRDTGVGIPPDKLEHVFERSYRVDPAGDPAAPGSGIGLAIVRDILRQHGCRVHAESVEGEGTTLSFTLPLAPPEREGRPDHEAEGAGSGEPVGPGDPGRRQEAAEPEETARPRLRIIRNRKPG